MGSEEGEGSHPVPSGVSRMPICFSFLLVVISLSWPFSLGLVLCVSLRICLVYFSLLLCLFLSLSLGIALDLSASLQFSVSISVFLSLPPSSLLFIYCVFPLTVKDLDTEKYFHLVSARPPALGVPALPGCGLGFLPPWGSGQSIPRPWERPGIGEQGWVPESPASLLHHKASVEPDGTPYLWVLG